MGHQSCGIVEDTMEIGGLDGVRSCILAFFRGVDSEGLGSGASTTQPGRRADSENPGCFREYGRGVLVIDGNYSIGLTLCSL